MLSCFAAADAPACALHLVNPSSRETTLVALGDGAQAFADAAEYRAKPGEVFYVPGEAGALRAVLIGVDPAGDPFGVGGAALGLPAGAYRIETAPEAASLRDIAFAWGVGAYRFTRYKSADREPARLAAPAGVDMADVESDVRAVWLTRDLVNTPTQDMGPAQLEAAVREVADAHAAKLDVVTGEALLKENYPMVHAVGRAATKVRAPRILELSWTGGDAAHVVLVGKGVCFDTGGLNLKPGDYMRNMKKDMGGAANALALAGRVMDAKLPVRLTLIIPAVENAVDGDAFRPGDILDSRSGKTVEIENTDAEGRLVLADALTRANEIDPDLVLDFATLTGAARVALGPELAPFYTDDESLAADLIAASQASRDPVWRMPLWAGYGSGLDSPIANVRNLAGSPLGGSITAALFLQRFVDTKAWMHFDIFAWNPTARPGRPAGGEMQGARAAFAMLAARFPRSAS